MSKSLMLLIQRSISEPDSVVPNLVPQFPLDSLGSCVYFLEILRHYSKIQL